MTTRHRDTNGRRAGRLLRVVGVLGAAAAVATAVVGWVLVAELSDSVEASLELSQEALVAIEESIVVARRTIGTVSRGVGTIEASLGDASGTFKDVGALFEETAGLVDDEVSASIGSVREALPPLIDSAELVSQALTSISAFGIDVAPREPIEQPLREIDADLLDLETRLRAQAGTLAAISDDFESFGVSASGLRTELNAVDEDLSEALVILAGYEATADSASTTVAETTAQLRRSEVIAKTLIVSVAALFGLAQVGPFYIAKLVGRLEPTRPHGDRAG